MHFELSPMIVWIALWIVNAHSVQQVNIFSNKLRNVNNDDNNDAKAIVIPRVFSENS